jgi:hypothetical protein
MERGRVQQCRLFELHDGVVFSDSGNGEHSGNAN